MSQAPENCTTHAQALDVDLVQMMSETGSVLCQAANPYIFNMSRQKGLKVHETIDILYDN